MHYDALIIGAGLSGLAAAVRLSHYGKTALLVEQHAIPGGLNSYFRRHGVEFSTGLHAVTNYVPPGTHGAPLTSLLRQLRLRHEDLELCPQLGSRIEFPGCSLRFDNDPERLHESIRSAFPDQLNHFDRFYHHLQAFDERAFDAPTGLSARTEMARFLRDPLLLEMLLCPALFYGNPAEGDMDFALFAVIWKSLFASGLARPRGGIRPLLDLLVDRLRNCGARLLYRTGVTRLETRGHHVAAIHLTNGEIVTARQIYSCAGLVETLGLCDGVPPSSLGAAESRISLVEVLAVLDCSPRELGIDDTIVFYCDTERFDYRCPESCFDRQAGVLSVPNNYACEEPLTPGMLRISSLGNYDRWLELLGTHDSTVAAPEGRAAYRRAKEEAADEMQALAETHAPAFADHVTFRDVFTPLTIQRFTGHARGALYGSPCKNRHGTTDYENLFLIGADEGFHGIVGAMLSGISMVNRYGLR